MTQKVTGKIISYMQIKMTRSLKSMLHGVALQEKTTMHKVALKAIESYVRFKMNEKIG
jgi:hypothetical protein